MLPSTQSLLKQIRKLPSVEDPGQTEYVTFLLALAVTLTLDLDL